MRPLDSLVRSHREKEPQEPEWLKWASMAMGYTAAIVLGFVMCFMFLNWRLAPVIEKAQKYDQLIQLYQRVSRNSMDCPASLLQAGPGPRRVNLLPARRSGSNNLPRNSRRRPWKKETMASTDDKPALKITLEDLARVEMPAQAPAGAMVAAAAGAKQYGNIAAPADGPAVATEEKGHIFLQGWFYLGAAGLVGSLIAWGICEPFFLDSHTAIPLGQHRHAAARGHVYLYGSGCGREHRGALRQKSGYAGLAVPGTGSGLRVHF